MKKILNIMAIAAMVLLAVSCGNDDNYVYKISHFYIYIDEDNIVEETEMNTGETILLKMEVWPSMIEHHDFTFKSDNEGVATVTPEGVVTAIAPGTCFIIVRSAVDPSVTKTLQVTVIDNTIPINDDAVDQSEAEARRR